MEAHEYTYEELELLNRLNRIIFRAEDVGGIARETTVLLKEELKARSVHFFGQVDEGLLTILAVQGEGFCQGCVLNEEGRNIPREQFSLFHKEEADPRAPFPITRIQCPVCRQFRPCEGVVVPVTCSHHLRGLLIICHGERKVGPLFFRELGENLSARCRDRFLGHPPLESEKKPEIKLREKELLLRELSHRVKNNLQVIYSLLNLQSRFICDSRDSVLFNESKNRVKAMALVHENLYKSSNVGKVNFSSYLKNLGGYLFRSYGHESDSSLLRINLPEIYVSMDTSINLGLIFNEVISNALKYALLPGQEEPLLIYLTRGKGITFFLEDQGPGFRPEATDSFGLNLVKDLSHQLDGEVVIDGSRGTRVSLHFEKEELFEFEED